MKSSNRSLRVLAAVAAACLLAGCVSAEKRIRSEKRSASHLALAEKLLEQRRSQEALAQADLALKEWKKNPDAWFVRGEINFSMGAYVAAIDDFTSAIGLRPVFTEARSWRAWARIESGDLRGAEEDYRTALQDRIYPTPEKIRLNLGLLLIRTGREEEGVAELKEAVRLNPAYARGHYEVGKVHERSGNISGAIVSYQAALGGMKDSADLNLRLALALERSGEGAKAREYFKRVIEINPTGPEAATARDHLSKLESPS